VAISTPVAGGNEEGTSAGRADGVKFDFAAERTVDGCDLARHQTVSLATRHLKQQEFR
jgi:hypothetical protein